MTHAYLVLHRRDPSNRDVYFKQEQFTDETEARNFAQQHLPAAIIRTLPIEDEALSCAKDPQKPYIVVLRRFGQYSTGAMGDYDPVSSWSLHRTAKEGIEGTIDGLLAMPKAQDVAAGIELKLF